MAETEIREPSASALAATTAGGVPLIVVAAGTPFPGGAGGGRGDDGRDECGDERARR